METDRQQDNNGKFRKIREFVGWLIQRVLAEIKMAPILSASFSLNFVLSVTMASIFITNVYITNVLAEDTGWELSGSETTTAGDVLVVNIDAGVDIGGVLTVDDDIRITGSVLEMAASDCTGGGDREDVGRLCFDGNRFKMSANGGLFTDLEGPAGDNGEDGADGDDGAQGPRGEDGAQGPSGDDGVQGPRGDDGAQGPSGDDGAQGPSGDDGAQGPEGADGSSCNVVDNPDGTKTIDCEDGSSVTVSDGRDGSIPIQGVDVSPEAECVISLGDDSSQAAAGTGNLSRQEVGCILELSESFAQAGLEGKLNVQLTPRNNPLQLFFMYTTGDRILVIEEATLVGTFDYLVQIVQ